MVKILSKLFLYKVEVSDDSGFIRFYYNLTPYLRFGNEKNIIAVRVDHTHIVDSRWYTGSGIYRNVLLYVMDQKYIHIVMKKLLFLLTPLYLNTNAQWVQSKGLNADRLITCNDSNIFAGNLGLGLFIAPVWEYFALLKTSQAGPPLIIKHLVIIKGI